MVLRIQVLVIMEEAKRALHLEPCCRFWLFSRACRVMEKSPLAEESRHRAIKRAVAGVSVRKVVGYRLYVAGALVCRGDSTS